jgi:LysR family glycine cleavage system transcriptional activator
MSTIDFRLPPIPCLIAFEARARLGSGVLVARELCISPSAVSHRIKQLEEATNLQLFRKTSGEAVLTADGQAYLEAVRNALNTLSHFGRNPAASNKVKKQLRIAAPPTFAYQIIIPRLSLLQENFPELRFELQLSVPLVGLKADDSDIEIRFGIGHYPGYHVTRILDEDVVPMCSPEYLAQHGPFETYEDLQRVTLLRCTIEPWHPWFQAAGLDWREPVGTLQFVDIGSCMQAAAWGHGIALARPKMAASLTASGRLIPVFDLSAKPAYSYFATCLPEALQHTESLEVINWLRSDLEHEDAMQALQVEQSSAAKPSGKRKK